QKLHISYRDGGARHRMASGWSTTFVEVAVFWAVMPSGEHDRFQLDPMLRRRRLHKLDIFPIRYRVPQRHNHHDSLIFAHGMNCGKRGVNCTLEIAEVPQLPETLILSASIRIGLAGAWRIAPPVRGDLRIG